MTKSRKPKLVILAVYRAEDGSWRGFCSPYDVTCNAATEKEAMRQLEDLVALYEEGLARYGYPDHLAIKELTDPQDRKVLGIALDIVVPEITRQMRERFLEYQRQIHRNQFRVRDDFRLSGFYYQPDSQAERVPA